MKKKALCIIGLVMLLAGIFFAFERSLLGSYTLYIGIGVGVVGILLMVLSKCRKKKQ